MNEVLKSQSETDSDEDYEQLNADQNRKQKKAGGWQSLGLDHAVFKGIQRKGYKQPTPIQRKSIPLVCSGCDVVAMSRTGSGKTAAFVIPMLQKLKKRDTRGIRALILSPTRELALQTFKIVKELGRFTGLYCACLIGGDSMDEQFAVLHQQPDILLATPGRLLHVTVEMNLKLNMVQYIVFDEADRLFEMGFAEQLKEILKRVPDSRQTLLFSATLPKMLIGFAKAGLSDPQLVRLDVESKLNQKLRLAFMQCCQMEKLPLMLNLCRALSKQKKKTIVFCATMKHVEHLVAVLKQTGLDPAYLYSQLDPVARKQNISRFRNEECSLLIVTDIAARGVDIPLLDYAINYHFPPKPKLFIHRVGRVARAGKSGTSLSFISPDEMAYLVDLFLFIGRPIRFVQSSDNKSDWHDNDTLIGTFPDTLVHHETEFLQSIEQDSIEISDLKRKAENALKKYKQTRPQPSTESMRRVKAEFKQITPGIHPFFHDRTLFPELVTENLNMNYGQEFLLQLKNWRPNQAIFELQNSLGGVGTISRQKTSMDQIKRVTPSDEKKAEERAKQFVPYRPIDAITEQELASKENGGTFESAAKEAGVEMTADDEKGLYIESKRKQWDRKRKKFVSNEKNQHEKKIRTEEGTVLPASYKSGRYEKWKKHQKLDFQNHSSEDDHEEQREKRTFAQPRSMKRANKNSSGGMTKGKSKNSSNGCELRNIDQIMKTRRKKAKIQAYQSHRREENIKRKQRTNKGKHFKRSGVAKRK